jgi:hypothetical protein
MGVLYTKSLYTKHGWNPSQIEMFLKVHTGDAGLRGGYATFESAGKVFLIIKGYV